VRTHAWRHDGFTLVELVVVIVLVGIVGAFVSMQLGPTIQAYRAIAQRATLTDRAETALRRIATEVRSAVPNSLRQISPQCVELVPTIDGGRLRGGPDVANPAAPGVFLDQFTASTQFDVLTSFTNPVSAGDLVVIGNQNTDDLYNGLTVATIGAVEKTPGAGTGEHRITLTQARTLPQGYDGGRFVVVPAAQQSVAFVCTGVESGAGRLLRITRNALSSAPSCPADTLATAAVLATGVSHCAFSYAPNLGATQESGFLQLQLTLREGGESVPLTLGAHVDNLP